MHPLCRACSRAEGWRMIWLNEPERPASHTPVMFRRANGAFFCLKLEHWTSPLGLCFSYVFLHCSKAWPLHSCSTNCWLDLISHTEGMALEVKSIKALYNKQAWNILVQWLPVVPQHGCWLFRKPAEFIIGCWLVVTYCWLLTTRAGLPMAK